MTDNYEYNKSQEPQTLDDSTPYADKQWLPMVDLNNGVYSNTSGNTIVQFNCQNIYNSQKFISPDMFFVIPLQMVCGIYGPTAAAYAVNDFIPLDGTDVNDGNNYPWWAMLSLKQGNHNLIHQAEIIVDDKSLQQTMPFINISTHFQMLSRMSQDDLKHLGHSVGFADELDNEKSIKFNSSKRTARVPAQVITDNGGFETTALEGNGVINNRVFSNNNTTGSAASYQIKNNKQQNFDCVNLAKNKQLNRYTVISGTYSNPLGNNNSFNDIAGGVEGVLMNVADLQKNFQPTVAYDSINRAVVYQDYAIIRLRDLYNSIEQMPLLRRWNAKINLYVNTGVCSTNIQVCTGTAAPTVIAGNPLYYFNSQFSTFSNTIPYNHNYIPSFPITSYTGATAKTHLDYIFYSGIFIKQMTPFAVNGYAGPYSQQTKSISIPQLTALNSGISMSSCTLYYSQQLLHPKEALSYVEKNRNKRVVFREVMFNNDANIAPGSFSKLVNSGIRNPLGILIVPTIAKGVQKEHFDFNFSQFQSPFDTCPNNFVLSLINVNAVLGGQNVLQQTMNTNFENFMEQIIPIDSITSGDYGITNGLLDQKYWQNGYKTYYIALDKSNPADKGIGRSLSVSFVNNSQCNIDVQYFIFYMKEIEVDVQTGEIIIM